MMNFSVNSADIRRHQRSAIADLRSRITGDRLQKGINYLGIHTESMRYERSCGNTVLNKNGRMVLELTST